LNRRCICPQDKMVSKIKKTDGALHSFTTTARDRYQFDPCLVGYAIIPAELNYLRQVRGRRAAHIPCMCAEVFEFVVDRPLNSFGWFGSTWVDGGDCAWVGTGKRWMQWGGSHASFSNCLLARIVLYPFWRGITRTEHWRLARRAHMLCFVRRVQGSKHVRKPGIRKLRRPCPWLGELGFAYTNVEIWIAGLQLLLLVVLFHLHCQLAQWVAVQTFFFLKTKEMYKLRRCDSKKKYQILISRESIIGNVLLQIRGDWENLAN